MDICDVTLKEVTEQFCDAFGESTNINQGADFLGLATSLLLMKSRRLLPSAEEEITEEEGDPRYEMIHSLLEYCRIKEAAKALSAKEESERRYFPRGTIQDIRKQELGLEEVSLETLTSLLQSALERSDAKKITIPDEEWHVDAKITWIEESLEAGTPLLFEEVFSAEKSRGELVVLFLALLELMKHKEVRVVRRDETLEIVL